MKVYGYSKRVVNDHNLLEMAEITFSMGPEELRMLAKFLELTAIEKEKHADSFDHEHLQDVIEGWPEDGTDIIVT